MESHPNPPSEAGRCQCQPHAGQRMDRRAEEHRTLHRAIFLCAQAYMMYRNTLK